MASLSIELNKIKFAELWLWLKDVDETDLILTEYDPISGKQTGRKITLDVAGVEKIEKKRITRKGKYGR